MEIAQKKQKHPIRNALLAVFAVLLLIIGSVAFVLRDEIKIFCQSLNKTPEAIASERVEIDKEANELFNKLTTGFMRDLTEEERKLLASGLLSPEEALALIKGEKPASTSEKTETDIPKAEISSPEDETAVPDKTTEIVDNKPEKTEPAETKPPAVTTPQAQNPKPPAATQGQKPGELTPEEEAALYLRIDDIIAEMYLLRATYLNEIEALIDNMKYEYIALPKEKHTLEHRVAIVEKNLPKGTKLENDCDAKMEALLLELSEILTKLNSDTTIIYEIRQNYAAQKTNKKMEIYNKYSSKLK